MQAAEQFEPMRQLPQYDGLSRLERIEFLEQRHNLPQRLKLLP